MLNMIHGVECTKVAHQIFSIVIHHLKLMNQVGIGNMETNKDYDMVEQAKISQEKIGAYKETLKEVKTEN